MLGLRDDPCLRVGCGCQVTRFCRFERMAFHPIAGNDLGQAISESSRVRPAPVKLYNELAGPV